MSYPVLDPVSQAYPRVGGRSPTCYSPVRRSCTPKGLTARLACVKHAASVRPEPGSNSPTKTGSNKPQHHGRGRGHIKAKHQTGTNHHQSEQNKLDTLLSSQKTPAHLRSIVRRSVEALFLLHFLPYTVRNSKVSRGPGRSLSGPGDRSPEGSFCPASR